MCDFTIKCRGATLISISHQVNISPKIMLLASNDRPISADSKYIIVVFLTEVVIELKITKGLQLAQISHFSDFTFRALRSDWLKYWVSPARPRVSYIYRPASQINNPPNSPLATIYMVVDMGWERVERG